MICRQLLARALARRRRVLSEVTLPPSCLPTPTHSRFIQHPASFSSLPFPLLSVSSLSHSSARSRDSVSSPTSPPDSPSCHHPRPDLLASSHPPHAPQADRPNPSSTFRPPRDVQPSSQAVYVLDPSLWCCLLGPQTPSQPRRRAFGGFSSRGPSLPASFSDPFHTCPRAFFLQPCRSSSFTA